MRRQILPGHLRAVNHNGTKLAAIELQDFTMRIYGPNGTTFGSPASPVRRTVSTGFALPEDTASAPEARATSAPRAAANIDALLALQGIEEDPTERRKRSVQRGKGALDVLDDLKITKLAMAGERVSVVARGEHLRAIRERGLKLKEGAKETVVSVDAPSASRKPAVRTSSCWR